MAKALTDAERQQIINLCQAGKSCRTIAKETGRSYGTVSNVAKSIGHEFGRSNALRASRARAAYGAEHRATLIAKAQANAERLLDQQFAAARLHNFDREGEHSSVDLDEPVFADKRFIAQAVRDLMRTALDIDRHDNKGDAVPSAFDEWLDVVSGQTQDQSA